MSSLARRTPSSRNKYKQIEKQSIIGQLMSAAARRSPCSRSKNKQIKRQEQIVLDWSARLNLDPGRGD